MFGFQDLLSLQAYTKNENIFNFPGTYNPDYR
jgi:hypothetical protein